jgi:hypothetical protein
MQIIHHLIHHPSLRKAIRSGTRAAGTASSKIQEVLVEQPCYLVDRPGATIAAIDDAVPDNDADSTEERAQTSRSQGRFEEAEPTMVAGCSLVLWRLATASLSWALSDVVTIVAVGL